jgi:hypothetical protein
VSGAQAQNLSPNASFSSLFMLDGWTVSSGTAWSSIDSDEVPNSGSVRVPNAVDSVAKGTQSMCLPVEEQTNYRVAASALWLDAESSATVNLWTWKDPGAGNFVAYFDEAELVSLPEPDASLLAIGAVATLACSRLGSDRRSDPRK